ncbi:hypothetical protein E4T56_gene11371 [Termitomyces sp. T112]|nr:hypothetical protein E4T56_gene11371 [Termitomyces sp. T112]
MPQQYVMASAPSTNSLHLDVEIEMMNTQQTHGVTALLDSGVTGLFLDLEFVKHYSLTMQPLPKPIPVYNINGMPNKAGTINSIVDLVLHYWNHAEHALQKHNSKKCSTCVAEDRVECQTQVQEHAAICACCAGPLPFADLDLLDPPPLAFPHREALYKDNWSNSGVPEEECRGEFGSICKLELLDKVVKVGDKIYATTIHPLPSVTEIWASQTMSQWLAQAFAANAAPQEFWDVVLPYLYAFEDVFFKALFNLLLECKSCKVDPLAPWEQDKLDTFLQENLDSSCICPSKSPMASLVFFIKKKDGSLQLVQDYWVLNAITVKNCYSLPLISKLINNLQSVQYFTKLDVWWGYNNVCIQKGDEWKAAFQTNQGLFELLIMFFKLTNSPATFQTMMNNIFWDLIVESVLYLKLEKCKFEHTWIEYLGLIISHGTAEMDSIKVAGVAEWLEPKNKKEVQAFLGFANFYQRFIQDFSHHTHPLFDLMEKDVLWS